MHFNTKKLTTVSMLSALGVAIVFLIRFPIFPNFSFLEYDPADVPILFGTLTFGPLVGMIMTVIVSIVQGVTVSSGSGVIGIFMHIVATGSMVLAIGLVNQWLQKSKFSLYAAGLAGIAVMTVVMIIFNIFITPLHTGAPRSFIIENIGYFAAFNLIKASLNVVISLLLYVPLRKIIDRYILR